MSTSHIVHTAQIGWIPLSAGISFTPITFFPGDAGYQLLLRLEPGAVVPRHQHTGEVHSLVLSGTRRIDGLDDEIGPGTYVHETVGNLDSWRNAGDEPCVVFIEANGRVEYLDDAGNVARYTDAGTARSAYLDWCAQQGVEPLAALAGDAAA